MKHYKLLSDAMLDGCKLSPGQAFMRLCDEQGNTCANGAVLHAVTGEPYASPNFPANLSRIWNEPVLCPVPECDGGYSRRHIVLSAVCAHLNNDHRWTREQIAGWVSTVEAEMGLVEIISEQESVNSKASGAQPPEPVAVRA